MISLECITSQQLQDGGHSLEVPGKLPRFVKHGEPGALLGVPVASGQESTLGMSHREYVCSLLALQAVSGVNFEIKLAESVSLFW